MKKSKPWHEDDVFWETWASVIFDKHRRLTAPEEVDNSLSLLRIKRGAKVLDLCCGIGRHSLELARRGFKVTGVDRTAVYLEMARNKAKKEGLQIEFAQGDMRTFCRRNTFDAVINLYTSFGYFENPAEDRQVVKNVYQSLKTGGVFLIGMMSKEVLARIFQERDWHEENGISILEERKISKNWSWIECRWIMLKNGIKKEFKVSHRLYSAVELTALLRECEFRRVNVYGDLKGAPYDHTAKILVVLARK